MKQRISVAGIINMLALLAIVFVCILPFYYVIVVSLSEPALVREGQVSLLPRGFSLKAYEVILSQSKFFNAFKVSVLRTGLGLVLNLALQCTMAYALSKKYIRGRRFLMLFVVFTILFNAGIIPTYLIVKYTGLINSLWALIIPDAISAWNVLILVSFFQNMPESIEESARIDGANDILVFVKLVLPLSLPAVSTIGLFIAVRHWNSLIDGVIYINSTSLKPLQVYLMDIIMRSERYDMSDAFEEALPSLSFQTAAIFSSTLPILLGYPFIQRYFAKGIMIGAIKG